MDTDLLLAVFVAVEGAHAFSAFLPSYFTIRQFANSPEGLANVRAGYAPAIGFNLALGGTVSAITNKPLPLVLAALVSAGMVLLYEGAIRNGQ